jgi:hypothetical protein
VFIIPMDGGAPDEQPQMIFSETETVAPTYDIFNGMEALSPSNELLSSLQ